MNVVDAVGASCAVPGVRPVVSIAGRAFMDSGVWSADNAQLATSGTWVLILSPFGQSAPFAPGFRLADQMAELERSGGRVFLIEPDPAARAAMGANPLDPAIRVPSARAGRAQGFGAAEQVRQFWSGN